MENSITNITVKCIVNKPIDIVWDKWTSSNHIINWNFASSDWCCPIAENDLRVGGRFSYRMEAADGSVGFDFRGIYVVVEPFAQIVYVIEDGRKVAVDFIDNNDGTTTVTEVFEAENIHEIELQRQGWQSILNNFKLYAETTN